MGSFQSGQMGQTVNLLAQPSKVRILHSPKELHRILCSSFCLDKSNITGNCVGNGGFERSSTPTYGRKRCHGRHRKCLAAARKTAAGRRGLEGESSTPQPSRYIFDILAFFYVQTRVTSLKTVNIMPFFCVQT